MGGVRSALAAGAVWAAAAAVPSAGAEPEVRVLLHEGSGPVQVGGARFAPGASGKLLRNGRAVGSRVALTGPVKVDGVAYRGRVQVRRSAEGLQVVNQLPIERYLEGSLLREVYPGWASEVLKAQAVVARTYALHRQQKARKAAWDLTAGVRSQVYGGIPAEAPQAARAVRATRGEILVFGGQPILAAYHSASGGRTASAEEVWGRAVPYLVSVPVEGEEDSPETYWRIAVSTANLGRALTRLGWPVGSVQEVEVLERSRSGRVRRVAVRGSAGRAELEGRDLRRAAGGLPSTMFQVRRQDDGWLFVGSGHGHGVGMSQWGARAMALRGADYREILAWFYPGAQLQANWGTGGES